MKKLSIFFLILLKINFLSAQITISDYNNKQEEKIYPKTIPFDSSSNWIEFKNLYEYKQYIGLKVFFPITSNNTITENRNGIITDVLYGDKLKNIISDFEKNCDSCPKLLNDIIYSTIEDKRDIKYIKLLFQVKNEKTNELSYYTYYELTQNILVQYFENQQQLFKNKVLIYDDLKIDSRNINCNRLLNDIKKVVISENMDSKSDAVPKEVKLERGSRWTCIDIALIKDSDIYISTSFMANNAGPHSANLKKSDHFQYRMFYILKNNLEETIAFESLNPLVGEEKHSANFHDPYCYNKYDINPSKFGLVEPNNPFILESSYIERERQRKIIAQLSIAKQREVENNKKLKGKNDLIKKQNDLNTKYGSKYGLLIGQNEISIGMNKEMCESSWGIPFSKNQRITAEKTIEIWYYRTGLILYFNNNVLFQIDE